MDEQTLNAQLLRLIFSECGESKDRREKSVFHLFRQNILLGELVQGELV